MNEIKASKRILVVGATGMVGKQVVYQLLNQTQVHKVWVVGRTPLTLKHTKLQEIQMSSLSFSDLHLGEQIDAVICCIGTTIKKAGTQAAFRMIDYDIPVSLAIWAKENNISQIHIVSALGADAASSIFYNRVKGEMEATVRSTGIAITRIYRPSLLLGYRTEVRMGELLAQKLLTPLSRLFVGSLKRYRPISAINVAKAMIYTLLHDSGTEVVIENETLFALSEKI